MRENVRKFVEITANEFDIKDPIIEIGSFQVPGQEELANLRNIFPEKKFIGCDIRNGKGVDRIENVECLSLNDESVGTVLTLDTLEHVENCFKALDEIYRILKKDGIVIMSSVMDFPIHDYPSDYWRFTPESFRILLNKFPVKVIGMQGNPNYPHTVFAIGIKTNDISNYDKIFENLKNNNMMNVPLKFVEKIKYKYYAAQIILRCLFGKEIPKFTVIYD
jgi:SAM-dependent methyltransferase